MGDIWSAMQWWDEGQLRILVLASLGFQWLLVLVVPLRNYTVQSWLRACIRLASICADVLAMYALATLLYRQAAGSADDYYGRVRWTSLPLEALWAPLLLVHLGGREELTAGGMDGDTALWVRHAAVLVTVTAYAFFSSLRYYSDDSDAFRLLASGALLLVAAVVSSCGKPWVLRRSSIRRLVAKSSLAKGGRPLMKKTRTTTRTTKRPGGGGLSEWCFTELGDRYKCWKQLKPRGTVPMLSQGDKVQLLLSGMSLHAARATLETRKAKEDQEILEPLKPWRRRRREQHEAAAMEEEPPKRKVDMIMKPWLRQALGLIYTRATVIFTPAYLACHAVLVPSLYVAAGVLFFAASQKKRGYSSRYSRADVNTTYALLCFTAALDVFGMLVSEEVHSLLSSACENLPGHNLLDSVLWTIRRPIVSVLLLRCYKGGSFANDEDRLYGRVLDIIRNKLEDVDKVEDKHKDDQDKDKDDKAKAKDKDDKGKDKNFDLDLSSYRSLSKRNWILRDEDLKLVRGTNTTTIRDSLSLANESSTKDVKVGNGTNDSNIKNNLLKKKPSEDLEEVVDRGTNDNNIKDNPLKKKPSEDPEGVPGTNDNKIQDHQDQDRLLQKPSEDLADAEVDRGSTNDNNIQDSLHKKKLSKDSEQVPAGTNDNNIQESLRKKPSEEDVRAVSTTTTNKDNKNIRHSLRKKPFDESVLIWHIATDLCFRVRPPSFFRFRPPHGKVARDVCTEAISNYMAYLLDSWPEMLMAGSRQHLFTEAMANMEHVVRKATEGLSPKLVEKQTLDGVILRNIEQEAEKLKDEEAYTVIDDACKLAHELLGIQDDDGRWELMHRVWVGMLCYSASMCRGELHAKSLEEGGEFLSSVWLLISLVGGRNLADRLQMPDDDDPEPEDKVVEVPLPAKDKGEPEAAAAEDKQDQAPDSEPRKKPRAGRFSRPDAGARAEAWR